MSDRWHVVTGEYPPAIGGIARFTLALARALAAQGMSVHVWTPGSGPERSDPGIEIHTLPDRFGRGSRQTLANLLDGAVGDTILLQYTPNILGRRGANVAFCFWLASRARRGADVRVVFHEPFFYFGVQSLARNGLAALHRIMAATLLSGVRTAYLSSPSWRALLQPYALGRDVAWTPLPITVGDPIVPTCADVDRVREQAGGGPLVGHLGGYAEEMRAHLRSAIKAVRAASPGATVLCIGRGSREFARPLDDPRVRATGELTEEAVAASMAACDVMVAPFEEGVTMRRTSVIAALAAGVPVVTTRGRYTEPFWTETGSVELVPVGDSRGLAEACARLLVSSDARGPLVARGRAAYQTHFSSAALLAALGVRQREHAAACHPRR